MRRRFRLLAAALTLSLSTTLALPVSAQGPSTPSPVHSRVIPTRNVKWSDITEVVIRAPVSGPAMWKLTRGNSVVWVLGILPQAPNDLQWDSRRLKRFMRLSKHIILPGQAYQTPEGSARWHAEEVQVRMSHHSVEDFVSPATWTRFSAAVAREQHVEHENFDMLDVFFSFPPAARAGDGFYNLVSHYRGIGTRTTQDIVAMAQSSAAEKITPYRTNIDYLTDDWLTMNTADSDACLNDFLDDTDFNMNTLPDEAKAWATGDVATLKTLFRDTPGLTCDLLVPEWRDDYELLHLQKVTAAIDTELTTPGMSVAIVPFSDLLREGGILDRVRDEGVEVSSPAE